MTKKGNVEINPPLQLHWTAIEWGEEFGEECAFEFQGAILRQPAGEAVGELRGHLLFPSRLAQEDFFELCDSHDQDLCDLAETIIYNREELALVDQFYLSHLHFVLPLGGTHLAIPVLEKLFSLLHRVFKVDTFIFHMDSLPDPNRECETNEAVRRPKRELPKLYAANLAIRRMYYWSDYLVWQWQ
jgi:hypothetical protein